ncbi:hypothetical protein GZH53_04850 [Flavihumibacter sp. R14]|nr:hypothetical protein [Flavihumibacter soli]
MELNVEILVIVGILAILLLYFIIRRNFKDQKDLEDTIKKSELHPDRHKGEKI